MISITFGIPQAILRFIAIIIALMIIGTSWQSPWISSFTLWYPSLLKLIITWMTSTTLWGKRHDHQTLHCASFYPSTMIINSSPHPLIILSSSPLEGPAIVLPVKQLWHILHVPVSTWFCAIFCSKFFFLCFCQPCSFPHPLIISLMISTTWRSCNRHKHQRVHQRPAL